jgi:hypothetical protein
MFEGSGIAIGLGLSGVCDLPKRCASSGGLLLLIGECLRVRGAWRRRRYGREEESYGWLWAGLRLIITRP